MLIDEGYVFDKFNLIEKFDCQRKSFNSSHTGQSVNKLSSDKIQNQIYISSIPQAIIAYFNKAFAISLNAPLHIGDADDPGDTKDNFREKYIMLLGQSHCILLGSAGP